jgi:NmrA-like family
MSFLKDLRHKPQSLTAASKYTTLNGIGYGKDGARALTDRGTEVVKADLDDEASLRSAFDGAYGAYCLTNFCTSTARKETAQGGNLARAAAAAGVQHAIWSTFEDTRKSIPLDDDRMPTLQEKYKVVHFDAKADATTSSGTPACRPPSS